MCGMMPIKLYVGAQDLLAFAWGHLAHEASALTQARNSRPASSQATCRSTPNDGWREHPMLARIARISSAELRAVPRKRPERQRGPSGRSKMHLQNWGAEGSDFGHGVVPRVWEEGDTECRELVQPIGSGPSRSKSSQKLAPAAQIVLQIRAPSAHSALGRHMRETPSPDVGIHP